MTTLTKDSGIDWIGKIPSHWEVKRVKDVSKIKKGKAVETFLEKSEEMLPCIDTNFLRGRDNIVYCNNGTKISSDKVLILWDGANAGELFFNENTGYLGSTFGVFNTQINNKFWFYYLKGIEQYSRDNLTGMGVPHVDGNVLKQTIALIPTKEQQEKIADYLDKETSKVDHKISILEQKYEKLEEYKQSVIFETVTKGLDSNVPMKNSGIDWIGEIPEHWEVKRVKEIFSILNKSNIASGEGESDGKYDFYISGVKTKKINKTNLNKKALLFPTGGNYMVHFPTILPCSYSTDVMPLVTKIIELKYGFYFFNSNKEYFNQTYFSGTGIKHLQRKEFFNSLITIPNKFEQIKIVIYLDSFCGRIDKKREIIKKQIELLKEYKQSIIYEAVTGKIEIN